MRLFIVPVVSLLAVGSLRTVTYAIPMDPQRQLVRGFRSSTPKPCETDETYFFSVSVVLLFCYSVILLSLLALCWPPPCLFPFPVSRFPFPSSPHQQVHLPKPDPHRPPSDSQHDSESHLLSHNPQPSLAADDDAHSTQSEYYYGDQDEDHQDDRNPLKHRMIEVQFLATIKVNSKPKPKPNSNGSNPTNPTNSSASSASSSFHYRLRPNFMPRLMLDEAVLEYLQFRVSSEIGVFGYTKDPGEPEEEVEVEEKEEVEEEEKVEEKVEEKKEMVEEKVEEKEEKEKEKKEKEKEEEKEEEKEKQEKQEKPKEAVFTHAVRDNILIPTVNMRVDFSKMKKPPPLLGDHDNNGDNWRQRMIIFPYPDPRAPCAFNWRLRGETEWVRGYHLPDWRPKPKMTKQPPLRKGVAKVGSLCILCLGLAFLTSGEHSKNKLLGSDG
ncbi:hypothetical protein C8R42DRAFT_90071 [Lentinula raphanica]|nr:hypothetical protein C8R42DRAFT_90071 [Lentinula raphanica]